MAQIELKNLDKVYRTGKMEYHALKAVDLEIEEGELTAIVGPSGSGKSTILNMITGIDRPTGGVVIINGERIDDLREDALARWRGENVGIIFQFFRKQFIFVDLVRNEGLFVDLSPGDQVKGLDRAFA